MANNIIFSRTKKSLSNGSFDDDFDLEFKYNPIIFNNSD